MPFEETKQKIKACLETDHMPQEVGDDEQGNRIKEKFWESGNLEKRDQHVFLCRVKNADRDMFIELKKEDDIIRSLIQNEKQEEILWNEHMLGRAMMFSIIVDGQYAGFCGINDVSCENWEIAIELRKSFRRRGIGYTAISIMLSEIKSRLGVDKFRAKIFADNYASQLLVEKLGATPHGIVKNIICDEADILRCEERYLDLIDERYIQTAEKFGVEPRKLLSHVLEYELKWDSV